VDDAGLGKIWLLGDTFPIPVLVLLRI